MATQKSVAEEFLDAPSDTDAEKFLGEPDTKQESGYEDMAFQVASRIMPGLSQFSHIPEVRSQIVNFLRGEASGVTGKDFGGEEGFAKEAGKVVGKYAPAAAGAAMAVPSGGMSLVPGALAAGLGAAGGEGARQIVAGLSGNVEEIKPKEAMKVGMETAIADLGIGVGVGAAKLVAPTVLQLFSKIPAESIKRAFLRPGIVKIGVGAREFIERQGVKALRRVQSAFENARTMAGREVQAGLDDLYRATKGEKFDMAPVADDAESIIAKYKDSPTAADLAKSDVDEIMTLTKSLRDNPHNIKGINVLKKEIGSMLKWTEGGMQKIKSDTGKDILRKMYGNLIAMENAVATTFKNTKFIEANSRFHALADIYDELAPAIGTRDSGNILLKKQFDKIAKMFNEGGMDTVLLEEIGKNLPRNAKEASRAMEEMLDAIAARELTYLPKGTPSGALEANKKVISKDIMRLFSAPQMVGAAIKSEQGIRTVGRGVSAAGVKAYEAPSE